jgi:hypothetical protein
VGPIARIQDAVVNEISHRREHNQVPQIMTENPVALEIGNKQLRAGHRLPGSS